MLEIMWRLENLPGIFIAVHKQSTASDRAAIVPPTALACQVRGTEIFSEMKFLLTAQRQFESKLYRSKGKIVGLDSGAQIRTIKQRPLETWVEIASCFRWRACRSL